MQRINESTLIPLSMMLIVGGGVAWLTTMYTDVKYNTEQINEIKSDQEKHADEMGQVLQKLAAIQEQLKNIEKQYHR